MQSLSLLHLLFQALKKITETDMISAKAKAAMESGDLAHAQDLYCDYLTTLDTGPDSIERSFSLNYGLILDSDTYVDYRVVHQVSNYILLTLI